MRARELCHEIMARNRVTRPERAVWNRESLDQFRDPEGIVDLGPAADAIVAGIRDGRTFALYGDYDADGITATAILYRFLSRHTGTRPEWALASRSRGYGLRASCVPPGSLVIVSDCGTSDEGEVAALRARGSDVLVIDHHTAPRDPSTHPATWLVNPKRVDSEYPFDGLCSAALAWTLCWRVCDRLGEPVPEYLAPLAAVGQIADSGTLRHEGRIVVKVGLDAARRGVGLVPGLTAILAAQGCSTLDADAAGWSVGPLLNAPGRMGDPDPAFRALVTDSPIEAGRLVQELLETNAARRTATDTATAAARSDIVVFSDAVFASGTWPSGVSGIVAARLAEEYTRPAFVASVAPDGSGSGSARSWGQLSVYDALAHCAPALQRWGGHRAAAGFRFGPGGLKPVISSLSTWVPDQCTRTTTGTEITDPVEVMVTDLTVPMVRAVERLGPFGVGFERPRLVFDAVVARADVMARKHARITVEGSPVIVAWWNRASDAKKMGIGAGARIRVTGTADLESWTGTTGVRVRADSIQLFGE